MKNIMVPTLRYLDLEIEIEKKIGRVYGWGKTPPGAILGSPRDLDKGSREAPNGGRNLEGD